MNPAYAGYEKKTGLTLNYRNQWLGISNGYNTFSAIYNQKADILHGGIGVIAWKDTQPGNAFNSLKLNAIYSYHFKINNKSKATLALGFGWNSNKINTEKLIFSNMINPASGTISANTEDIKNNQYNWLDFSTGTTITYKLWNFGLGIKNITTNQNTPNNTSFFPEINIIVEKKINLDKNDTKQNDLSIYPSIHYIHHPNAQQLISGIYFVKDFFQYGIWLRNYFYPYLGVESIICGVGFNIGYINIFYSYDIVVNKQWRNSYGAHEISIGIRFNKKQKNNSGTITCPAF